MNEKSKWRSVTLHLSGALTAIGVLFVSLPDILSRVLLTAADPQVAAVINLLPPGSKMRHAIDVLLQIVGGLNIIFGVGLAAVRIYKTNQPVKKPFSGLIGMLLICVLFSTGCGTVLQSTQPTTTPQTPAEISAKHATELKKAVIAVHDGLYIPIMTTLAALYNAGNTTVVAREGYIQAISEQYIQIKTEATTLIDVLGAAADEQVTASLKAMAEKITELQKIKASAGDGGVQ